VRSTKRPSTLNDIYYYFIFNSPVDISTPRIGSVSSPITKKKTTSTVSMEIRAIFDRLKIK
jgi:hypothetical protein